MEKLSMKGGRENDKKGKSSVWRVVGEKERKMERELRGIKSGSFQLTV